MSFIGGVFFQDIISVDPCHKFTWCLDACIREKNVDIKRSRELQVRQVFLKV